MYRASLFPDEWHCNTESAVQLHNENREGSRSQGWSILLFSDAFCGTEAGVIRVPLSLALSARFS